MNSDTGHLVRIFKDTDLQALRESGYEELPADLQPAAEKALAGRDETVIPRKSRGKLGRWAAQRRRARRGMEKATRKAQRRRK